MLGKINGKNPMWSGYMKFLLIVKSALVEDLFFLNVGSEFMKTRNFKEQAGHKFLKS